MKAIAITGILTAICLFTRHAIATGIPAFPGAEGAAAQITGGRGMSVYHVTRLDDITHSDYNSNAVHNPSANQGLLRDALHAGSRTIVFDVAGNIDLVEDLVVDHVENVTIAGQTAPGDGICIRNYDLQFQFCGNIIIRFIRSRLGTSGFPPLFTGGTPTAADYADQGTRDADSLGIVASHGILIDHCSLTWSSDVALDMGHNSGGNSVQWCIIGEPMYQSGHIERGVNCDGSYSYTPNAAHADACVLDGIDTNGNPQLTSFHHNFVANANNRMPRMGYSTDTDHPAALDVTNNVFYNWGDGSAYDGTFVNMNWRENYHRYGPATKTTGADNRDLLFAAKKPFVSGYFYHNYLEGYPSAYENNMSGSLYLAYQPNTTNACTGATVYGTSAAQFLSATPFDTLSIVTLPAQEAEDLVLRSVGASALFGGSPVASTTRDTNDARMVLEVTNGTAYFGNGGTNAFNTHRGTSNVKYGIIDSPIDLKSVTSGDHGNAGTDGYPVLQTATAFTDTDGDGLPDAWQTANGLGTGAGSADPDGDGYTNLEDYFAFCGLTFDETNIGTAAAALPGSATVSKESGLFEIYACGTALGETTSGTNGPTADSIKLINFPFIWDGSISMRMIEVDRSSHSARTGLMLRANLSVGSPFFFAGYNGDYQFLMVYRTTQDGATTTHTFTALRSQCDGWVKLERSGNAITAAYSYSDPNVATSPWTSMTPSGAITISLGDSPVAGIAATPYYDTKLNYSAVDQMKIRTALPGDYP